jgi:glycosyltransferase involved in cell wall biosynthesis
LLIANGILGSWGELLMGDTYKVRKWAYMGIPHTGGTYSVFKNLRAGLLQHGVELRWVAVGSACTQRLSGGEFASEMQFGTVVAPTESDDSRQGSAVVEFFEKGEYEGVFVNALCGLVATNFVRYLDSRVPRIMIVHTITVGTYAAARAVRDYVHATVGVSPRIGADLVRRKGFEPAWTVCIPNAVQMDRFAAARQANPHGPLRVLSLGRIEDGAKGCFLLPQIITHVQKRGIDIEWQIAGDGPDLEKLKSRCASLPDVKFLGRVAYDKVPQVLAGADVYIFPSRYEGLPVSLVEAMAAGCVPVASAIRGVTDGIVEHGRTGCLFPIGSWRRAAEYIVQLAGEPQSRQEMAEAASQSVRDRFSIEAVAKQYIGLMEKVLASPRPLRPPLEIRNWSYPRGLRAGLRTRLPESLKTRLRVVRESIYGRTA